MKQTIKALVPVLVLAFSAATFAGDAGPKPPEKKPSLGNISSANNDRLREALKRYPDADANKDGMLTLEEARGFMAKNAAKGLEAAKKQAAKGPAPTWPNISYGPHPRNVLDFWKAPGETPRPVVVFIHGGGFIGGDKSSYHGSGLLLKLLENGVSCAAINYRFLPDAPVHEIMREAARAVQFIRSKAGEWNVDKAKIAADGGSAGAGTSLWLDTRDDLADPKNADIVLRESSRVAAAVINSTQATYNLPRWETFLGPIKPEWADPTEVLAFYHLKSQDDLKTPAGENILRECDMLEWISKDDGPVLAVSKEADGEIRDRGHFLHHPKHAQEVQKVCEKAGVPCEVIRANSTEKVLAFLLRVFSATGAPAQK
jgi:acetyl esterase/lipase